MTAQRKNALRDTMAAAVAEMAAIEADEVARANTLGDLAAAQINGYTDTAAARKAKYHSLARRKLRRLANLLGLASKDYRLSTNAAGPAVCGETTLHTDALYIQVSQSALGSGHEILFRRCKGRDDYSGAQNYFAPARRLDDVADFYDGLQRAGLI